MHFKTFLLVYYCAACAATNLDLFCRHDTKKVEMDLINITTLIIEKIFLKTFPAVNFINAVENNKNHKFFDFRDAMLKAKKGSTVCEIYDHKYIYGSKLEKKRNVIVMIDTYTSLKPLLDSFATENFDSRGYFLFVLINETLHTQRRIFQEMLKLKIMNANVIYPANETTIVVKTFQPFNSKSCVNVTLEVVAEVTDGNFKGNWEDLYPDKTRNFYGCPLRVAIPNECPSACVQKVRGRNAVVGYDVSILNVISRNLNLDLRLVIVNNSVHRESGVETLMMLRNRADIALHSLGLTLPAAKNFDHSMVYLTMPIVFVVPPGRLLGFFEKILQPFDSIVWILLLFTFFTALVILFLLEWKLQHIRPFFHEEGTGSATMNFVAAILGLGQLNLPSRNSPRIVLLTFLIFCLILRNVYQGLLFDLMQSDGRHKEVESIKELIDEDFTILMYEAAEHISKIFPSIYNRREIVKMQDFRDKHLEEGSKEAFLTTLADAKRRIGTIVGSYGQKICREHLTMVDVAIFFNKRFPAKSAIDSELKKLTTHGFIQKYFKYFTNREYRTYNHNFALDRHLSTEPTVLEFYHLEGVFIICLVGLIISTAAFAFEMLVEKIAARRRVRD